MTGSSRALLAAACVVGAAVRLAAAPTGPGGTAGPRTTGLVYRVVDGRSLLMDVQQPKPTGTPRPAVVFLCGNGWGYTSRFDRTEFEYGLDLAAARGYVGVTVDYSSTRPTPSGRPVGSFPAQVWDVKTAIRFLRESAETFDIDPRRIAVVGHSSGGTLALLLGLTRPADGLEGADSFGGFSSAVQAVVNFAGPADLASDYAATPEVDAAWVGGTPSAVPEKYRAASPVTYARAGAPPILSIHGDKDTASFLQQSLLLDSAIKAAGGRHTLIVKKGAGHFDFSLADPAVWSFLGEVLRP